MKIYIVSGLVDTPDEQSTATLSAHIDENAATQARSRYDREHAGQLGRYAVVETVELDLTADGMELQRLREEVIRQQAQMARGRRS